MHIFLYGPPGTGKSTIGKLLARNLKMPFIDLDRVIEANAGTSISRIMDEQGEIAFRDMESAALKDAVGGASGVISQVIALGGGALLREENRKMVENTGFVVLLIAGLETLLPRLASNPDKRPLLTGDLREKLTSLLASRKEHYDSFHLRIDANQVSE
jgi:shikimate kinase